MNAWCGMKSFWTKFLISQLALAATVIGGFAVLEHHNYSPLMIENILASGLLYLGYTLQLPANDGSGRQQKLAAAPILLGVILLLASAACRIADITAPRPVLVISLAAVLVGPVLLGAILGVAFLIGYFRRRAL